MSLADDIAALTRANEMGDQANGILQGHIMPAVGTIDALLTSMGMEILEVHGDNVGSPTLTRVELHIGHVRDSIRHIFARAGEGVVEMHQAQEGMQSYIDRMRM